MANTNKTIILSNHKRIGKKLIPPIISKLDNKIEISWIDLILPEILWIGLLNLEFGLEDGAELSLYISKLASIKTKKRKKKNWFALTTSFDNLTLSQKTQIVDELKQSKKLEYYQNALLPLVLFYPDCPLNFIFKGFNIKKHNRENIKKNYRDNLNTLIDRWSKDATFMQANATYIAFCTDLLKVDKNTSLAKFPNIIDYPKTKESEMIAAGVRGHIFGYFGSQYNKHNNKWASYFWKRGIIIDKCIL